MNNFFDSVCLITCRNSDAKPIQGTGFVVHQAGGETYIITCAHVVREDQTDVQVNGRTAVLVGIGKEDWLDFAVYTVRGLEDKTPLELSSVGEAGCRIKIPVIAEMSSSKEDFLLRPLNGTLGELINPMSASGQKLADAWDLKINDGEFLLREGNSGSPVIDIESNKVVGIVRHKVGGGGKGIAISVNALREIWVDIPRNLIEEGGPIMSSRSGSKILTNLSTSKLDLRKNQISRDISIRKADVQSFSEMIRDIAFAQKDLAIGSPQARIDLKNREELEEKLELKSQEICMLIDELEEIEIELKKRKQ
jgi:S1-C subfamily serine protease